MNAQDASSAASQSIPLWTYEKLPRDCLLVLLESALKHMPQTADVVDRCMRVLSPLSTEEHNMCFGSTATTAIASAGCNGGFAGGKHGAAASELAKHWSEVPAVDPAAIDPAQGGETRSKGFPTINCTTAGSWYGRGPAVARAPGYGRTQDVQEMEEMRPRFSKPSIPPRDENATGSLETFAVSGVESNGCQAFPMPPSGGGGGGGGGGEHGSQAPDVRGADARGGGGEAGPGRGIKKASGARAAMRLTESRAGTRTSILTEEQAIQVFKQRPMERSARAVLCSQLAEHYGVTTTAIRHIWDRRTWVWTNLPFWNEEELAASLAEGTCDNCRTHKVARIQDTCDRCPINRKRGRPRGARDSSRRVRKNP